MSGSTRLYRRLLALYPPSFRRRFGEDIAQLFADRYREAHGRGRTAVAGLWLRALADLAGQALREHLFRGGPAPRLDQRHTRAHPLELLGKDLRLALRSLARRPSFSLTVVAVVALGIGLNTALLSVVKATLVDPLPFARPERLAVVVGALDGQPGWSISVPEMRDFIARNDVFEEIGIYSDFRQIAWSGRGVAESLPVAVVSAAYFEVLGTRPLLGRTFSAEEDDGLGAHPVAVLSHDLWQRSFGGDLAILGREIRLAGRPHRIVGVMPRSFQFSPVDVFLPLSMGAPLFGPRLYEDRRARWFSGIGRLDEGVDLEAAQKRMSEIAVRLRAEHPESDRGRSVDLRSPREHFLGFVEQPVRMLSAGAGLVLLICCANVAALLLVRALARRREVALRSALGASGARLGARFLTEGLVLTAAGGALGIALAVGATRRIVNPIELGLPLFTTIEADPVVLAVSVLLVTATGVVLGLLPALRFHHVPPRDALSGGPWRAGGGRRDRRSLLIAAEVAVAIVLLVGAGLTAKSLHRLATVELGYEPLDLLTMRFELVGETYRGKAADREDQERANHARIRFTERLEERVEALPGVASATLWGPSMLGSADLHDLVAPEGADPTAAASYSLVQYLTVGPGALADLGMPLLEGRDFSPLDSRGEPGAAILSVGLARRLYPEGSALGRRIYTPRAVGEGAFWEWTVVGVAENARHAGRQRADNPAVLGDLYLPHKAFPGFEGALLVRSAGPGVDPYELAAAVRREVAALDPGVPISDVATMSERLRAQESVPRFAASLMSLYALVAVLLAFVGIYGVLAFTVQQRRAEMAVRAALGASRGSVMGLVLRKGMVPVCLGVVAGLGAASFLSRLVESVLFGVERMDAGIYTAVALGVLAASALACTVPALRASRADPAVVLRYE